MANLFHSQYSYEYSGSHNKLIFDVEAAGQNFDDLDEVSQKMIEEKSENEEEFELNKQTLGFSPLTGEVVAIGVLNPETMNGTILLREGKNIPAELEPGIAIETYNEKELLERFWEIAKNYNYFITFNGRGFDVPYLCLRSAINGVRPTKNLMEGRYLYQQKGSIHLDLFDQLSFYGSSRFKNSSLHFYSKAFGLESPKADGVSGDDVDRLFREGKLAEIAKYNLGDLKATKGVYDKWNKYLNL